MFFSNILSTIIMFYSVELQMAGVILLTAMAVGGISLWLKRRKLEKETRESVEHDVSENL
jgi:nicotinamide riboside transporter PnuC